MRQPVSHYDEYDERGDAFGVAGEERDEPAQRDRRLPAIALTLLVMALFAGGLWFAYVQGMRHAAVPGQTGQSVPLIRADERPTKVKPDEPGGMTVPDQDVSLYSDKPAKPSLERLLPPPEQPMPRPAPPPPPALAVPATVPGMLPGVLGGAAPSDTPADLAPAPNAPQLAPAKPAATASAEPKHTAPPNPAAQPKVPAAAPADLAPIGKIQVRLGSLRSPEAAREEWTRLKRENADLLGNLRAFAVAVDLGDKGLYYRILAGPFTDTAAAELLCSEMKRRSRGCILAQ